MDSRGGISPRRVHGPEPRSGERVILLVHGFNNNTDQANESFFTMRQNLDLCLHNHGLDETARKRLQEDIWELYWPGYIGPQHPAGMQKAVYGGASAATYFLHVAKASTWVPESLARYLRERRPSSVFFIGHSLGCRVILETINQLTASTIPILGFILMAAAVPIHHLIKRGSLRRAISGKGHQYCLYSFADKVLLLAFPGGQILAQDRPRYLAPIATGLTGWPAAIYTGRAQTGYDHGDYWANGLAGGRSAYSNLLANVLGIATSAELMASELAVSSRSQLKVLLPARHLAWRDVAGLGWLSDTYGPRGR